MVGTAYDIFGFDHMSATCKLIKRYSFPFEVNSKERNLLFARYVIGIGQPTNYRQMKSFVQGKVL